MEKVRLWCGQPSDRGRLKNRTEQQGCRGFHCSCERGGGDSKKSKYSSLSPLYDFTPIAVETLGAVGEAALDFIQELGHRISSPTAEPRSFSFLMQRLSVAVHCGNAICITGTAPSTSSVALL